MVTIIELIKALEIKTSMLYNVNFTGDTILSCFFFFCSIVDLYFLIPAAIAQILNPTARLVIPIEIQIKEIKAKIESHPVIVEAKIGSNKYNLGLCKPFCALYSSIHFSLFFQGSNFLFLLYFLI